MKTLLLIAFLFVSLFVQGQTSTIQITKLFRPDAPEMIVPSTIECRMNETKGSTIQVTATITANLPHTTLQTLGKMGIFTPKARTEDGIIKFYMSDAFSKVLIIKGKVVNYDIKWSINVPESVNNII